MTTNSRIAGLYEENAEAWDRQRGRDLHEKAWLDRFVARLPAGGSILDLGCGMGEPVTRYLIERGFAVTGVDSAPSLIAMCKARFPAHEWIAADMRMLDLRRRFDGLIAWHSLFHLTPNDQRPMFARFAAHVKHGGPLMFTSGPGEGEAIGAWQNEPLYHGSLAPEEYRVRLAENGFARIRHKARDPDCGSATIWLAIRS